MKWHKVGVVMGVVLCMNAQSELQRDPFSWPELRKQKQSPSVVVTKQRLSCVDEEKKKDVSLSNSSVWRLVGVSQVAGVQRAMVRGKDNRLMVACVGDEVGSGWTVASITERVVAIKHHSGDRKVLTL